MEILLLSPPFLPFFMRNARCDFVSLSGTQWYPILLGYCGAWLETFGYHVKLIDAPTYGLSHDATERMVADYKPDWLVLYTGRLSEDNDVNFADNLIEKYGCKGIIVGPYASISPKETLRKSKYINYLITGEFEMPVQELIEGKRLSSISNLVFKDESNIIENSERPYLETSELDKIPFISRFIKNHLNIYKYRTISEPYPFLDIFTGRGCSWGKCTYCLYTHSFIKGSTYNCRSIENVIEELSYISKDMPQVKSVMLQDDTFSPERAVEFCEAKLKADIKLQWSCYSRANIPFDVLKLMKKANCLNLHVGFESADQEVLNTIKKGLTYERMTKFASDAKKIGLRIHGDFALGFPKETKEKAEKTINWALKIRPHTAQFQLMIPFPGTEYYKMMKEKGWLDSHGRPDMPQFPNHEIRKIAKKAYRSFYISPRYLLQSCLHPYESFFCRFRAMTRAIPSIFWEKWKV